MSGHPQSGKTSRSRVSQDADEQRAEELFHSLEHMDNAPFWARCVLPFLETVKRESLEIGMDPTADPETRVQARYNFQLINRLENQISASRARAKKKAGLVED